MLKLAKTDKLCARCDKPIHQIRDIPIANHTNVEHPDDIHYFCGRDCKLIWLAKRMKESEQEVFICKYCKEEFEKEKGKVTHETWCLMNPNARPRVVKDKEYTIEDLRKIDRAIGLTDEQIAKFVRGSNK